ncbi:MAG: hypothetical protein HUU08_09710 [Candidatus Brocadia sp.]|nr:hypothetical protein [Candidatus Brocadia sp.]
MMTINRIASLFIITFIATFFIWPSSWSHGEIKKDIGKKKIDGLKASITSISWVSTSQVEIEYSLERIKPTKTWVINPSEPANIHFWNKKGQRVDNDDIFEIITIDPDFIDGKRNVITALITSNVPNNAISVSVAFGRSGLETKRKKLPPVQP